MSEPLIIVGNGMAAARLVDEPTRCALARHAIAVIGDEPRLAYNRVLLSSVLAGETAPEDIELKPMSWWRDRGVTLKVGCPATELDVGRREIKIANGGMAAPRGGRCGDQKARSLAAAVLQRDVPAPRLLLVVRGGHAAANLDVAGRT